MAILDEKALEEKLVREWPRTVFAKLGVELVTPERHGRPGRQVLTPVNAIDLLGYRRDRREWWVIELKHGRPADQVVGQVAQAPMYPGEVLDPRTIAAGQALPAGQIAITLALAPEQALGGNLHSGDVVAVTLSRCSAAPRTVTEAPGRTPPLASRTAPAMEPVTWATACM